MNVLNMSTYIIPSDDMSISSLHGIEKNSKTVFWVGEVYMCEANNFLILHDGDVSRFLSRM